jgi:hypothetical protein
MVCASTHGLFGILPEIFTYLLIWRKPDELVMVTEYFPKSFHINITKTWVTINELKFNGPKKPSKDKKKTHGLKQRAWV